MKLVAATDVARRRRLTRNAWLLAAAAAGMYAAVVVWHLARVAA